MRGWFLRSLRLYVGVSLIVWLAFAVYAMRDPADAYSTTGSGPVGTVLTFWFLFWTVWMLLGGLPTVGLALMESLAIREPGRQWAWRLVVLVSVSWFPGIFLLFEGGGVDKFVSALLCQVAFAVLVTVPPGWGRPGARPRRRAWIA